jgi:hypothetical protein
MPMPGIRGRNPQGGDRHQANHDALRHWKSPNLTHRIPLPNTSVSVHELSHLAGDATERHRRTHFTLKSRLRLIVHRTTCSLTAQHKFPKRKRPIRFGLRRAEHRDSKVYSTSRRIAARRPTRYTRRTLVVCG